MKYYLIKVTKIAKENHPTRAGEKYVSYEGKGGKCACLELLKMWHKDYGYKTEAQARRSWRFHNDIETLCDGEFWETELEIVGFEEEVCK